MKPYRLLGWHLSYFTGKVLCYLRYKGIAFEGPHANAWVLTRQIPKRFGATVMPVVVTPEGTWIQDSSDIMHQLEARFPQRSIHPDDPVARSASCLLEAWGDEWWVPVAMHSRWSYPENRTLFLTDAGDELLPGLPGFVRRAAAEKIASKLENMLHGVGVRRSQFDVLEGWTERMLDLLDAHFARHAFLLGEAPCLGDFGLVGTFYGHLARDPWPLREWVEKRRNLHAWVRRMANPGLRELPANKLSANTWAVGETLEPILRTVFAEFTSMVAQTNEQVASAVRTLEPGKMLRRGLRDIAIDTTSGTLYRTALPFTVWKAQGVLDAFAAMTPQDQLRVRQWASPLGGDAFLDLQLVRLERVGLRVRP